MFNTIKQHTGMALQGGGVALSYTELLDSVHFMVNQLRQRGITRLGLLMDNHPAWVVVDLACQQAGITLIPLPGFFSSQQIQHAIADGGLDHLLLDQHSCEQFAESMHEFTPLPEISGVTLYLAELTPQRSVLEGVAKVTYTSGTTGTPKGVCLGKAEMERVSRALCQQLAVNHEDRHLCLLPLAVLLENIGGVYVPLLSGGEVIVPSLNECGMRGAAGLDVMAMYQVILRYQPTSLILLPQMLQALVELGEAGHHLPDSLRFIAVGGSPISESLLLRAATLHMPVFEGYGLSECSSVVALNCPGESRPGSVGKLLPHLDIDFTAEGEILLKGNHFQGYLNQPRQEDGWLATGDLGYLDDEGYLYLVGRKKNIFITSLGRNVAPEWVERELSTHGAIAQAAVFGEARPFNVALVVPRGECSDTEIQQAVDSANRQLPDYARISHWLRANEPFSISNQQYTATGRPRREAIWSAYQTIIETCYESEGTQPKEAI